MTLRSVLQDATTANEAGTAVIQAREVQAGTMAKDNGAASPVAFDEVKSGTPMGQITASKKWRPCAKQLVDDAQTSVNEINMASVEHFKVGDVVSVYDVSGATTLATSRNITAIDSASSPPSITIDGAAVTTQAGDYVYVEDGSGTCGGVLLDGVDTKNSPEGTDADQPIRVVIDGVVNSAQIPGYNALIAADLTNLKAITIRDN